MADDQPGGYTTGEKVAGVIGALLFLGLALIAIDLASGGRVFRPRKQPCGCGQSDEAALDDGD